MAVEFDLPVVPLKPNPQAPQTWWFKSFGPRIPPHQVKPGLLTFGLWHWGHEGRPYGFGIGFGGPMGAPGGE